MSKPHPDPVTEEILRERPAVRAAYQASASRIAWIASVINARAAKGWTQTELARAIGVQQPAIAKLESGDRDPRLSTMVAVCQALGIEELRIPIMPRAS